LPRCSQSTIIGIASYMSQEQTQGQRSTTAPTSSRRACSSIPLLTGETLRRHRGRREKIIQDDPVWPSTCSTSRPTSTASRARARQGARAPLPERGKFRVAEALAAGQPPEDAKWRPPPTIASPRQPPGVRGSGTGTSSEAEKEFWNEVKDSSDPRT